MRKIYLPLFLMLAALPAISQISVTATAGTAGPTAYTTLKAAFDAVNAGTHKGIIGITVNGNTTETSSAVLNASGNGAASYTNLSVKAAGGTASTITGSVDAPLVDLNGASNVTIDGLNTGGNSLTISNASINAAATTSTIRFVNDAVGNCVKNTTILGASSSVTLGTIYFAAGTTTGNNYDTVTNCTISNAGSAFPVNAIYSSGSTSAGQENNGVVISNNNISNFYNAGLATAGILVAAGNTSWAIKSNKFFQTTERIYTTGSIHRAIQISSGMSYNITDNIIGYASAVGTGVYAMSGAVASRFIGIDVAVGSGEPTNVQNNTVSGFSLATSSGASTVNGIWCAINVTAGSVNIGTSVGNTIGSTTAASVITVSPTTSGAAIVPINSASSGTVVIANNTIGGIDLLPSAALSGSIQCIQASGTVGGTISIINNIIGNSIANNIKVGVLNTTTGNGVIRGVFNTNIGTVLISGNTIRNLTHNSNNAVALFRAIECQQGTATISNNIINNITAYGVSTTALTPEGAGILITTALPGLTVDGNTISNLNVTNSTPTTGPFVTGIYLGSTVTGVAVTRNKISSLTNAGTSTSTTVPSGIIGLYFRDAGAANPNVLCANNMISLGNAQSTNSSVVGIWNAVASTTGATFKIYYNTVNIEGAVAGAGTQPSFCYYRGDFTGTALSSPIVDIKNNLFTNSRSGGGGRHFAIANGFPATASSGGWGVNASNYNILNASANSIGYWSVISSFSDWQAASAGDANSYSGVAITYVNPASDLHLVTTANAGADGKATPIATTTIDIDNNTRSATIPDIGADEFVYDITVPIHIEYFNGKKSGNINVLNWKANCTASSMQFDIEKSTDGRLFNSIASFTASQLRCAQPFDFTDNNPQNGVNYYRLKMKEPDGKIMYSLIIAIINKENGLEIVGLMPTFTESKTTLSISSTKNIKMNLIVIDVTGKIVHKQQAALVTGSNMVDVDVSTFPNGAFLISGFTAEGYVRTVRFIKQ